VAGSPETLSCPEVKKHWAYFPYLNFTRFSLQMGNAQGVARPCPISFLSVFVLFRFAQQLIIFCSVSETTTMTFVQQGPPNLLALVTETEPEM